MKKLFIKLLSAVFILSVSALLLGTVPSSVTAAEMVLKSTKSNVKNAMEKRPKVSGKRKILKNINMLRS